MKKLILLALCFIAQYFVHDFDAMKDKLLAPVEANFVAEFNCEDDVVLEDDSIPKNINFIPKGSYKQLKQKIREKRAIWQAEFLLLSDSTAKNNLIDSLAVEITSLLVNQIIPFWYGTEWDFNGYTAVPNQGEIACGYFVSTTLRDVGFRLNRYHFAQRAGWNASKSIQKNEKLLVIRTDNFQALREQCNLKLKDGLYFVGLDNHVGYLLLQNQELYFIHSDYVSDKVVFEQASKSLAFMSNLYVICPITHNQELTKDWILNNEIPIVRS